MLHYPSTPTELGGAELEKGLTALVEYLTQKRQDLAKESSQQVASPRPSQPYKESLIKIDLIDCYLKKKRIVNLCICKIAIDLGTLNQCRSSTTFYKMDKL